MEMEQTKLKPKPEFTEPVILQQPALNPLFAVPIPQSSNFVNVNLNHHNHNHNQSEEEEEEDEYDNENEPFLDSSGTNANIFDSNTNANTYTRQWGGQKGEENEKEKEKAKAKESEKEKAKEKENETNNENENEKKGGDVGEEKTKEGFSGMSDAKKYWFKFVDFIKYFDDFIRNTNRFIVGKFVGMFSFNENEYNLVLRNFEDFLLLLLTFWVTYNFVYIYFFTRENETLQYIFSLMNDHILKRKLGMFHTFIRYHIFIVRRAFAFFFKYIPNKLTNLFRFLEYFHLIPQGSTVRIAFVLLFCVSHLITTNFTHKLFDSFRKSASFKESEYTGIVTTLLIFYIIYRTILDQIPNIFQDTFFEVIKKIMNLFNITHYFILLITMLLIMVFVSMSSWFAILMCSVFLFVMFYFAIFFSPLGLVGTIRRIHDFLNNRYDIHDYVNKSEQSCFSIIDVLQDIDNVDENGNPKIPELEKEQEEPGGKEEKKEGMFNRFSSFIKNSFKETKDNGEKEKDCFEGCQLQLTFFQKLIKLIMWIIHTSYEHIFEVAIAILFFKHSIRYMKNVSSPGLKVSLILVCVVFIIACVSRIFTKEKKQYSNE